MPIAKKHMHCISLLLDDDQSRARVEPYLTLPIMTPTLSPFLTPMFKRPCVKALMCLSNSSKSQTKCVLTPRLCDSGPPCPLDDSFLQMRAGRALCFSRTSREKYSERVALTRGGCKGPSTDDMLNDRPAGRETRGTRRHEWRRQVKGQDMGAEGTKKGKF
jgi:hypothetical protein